jgi:uncharacterized SAM-binding protein YcdF (DUF218 family)
MRTFLSLFISPLPVFWILVAVAFLLYKKGKQGTAKAFGTGAMVLLGLVSTPFVPNLLVKTLENQNGVISIEELKKSEKPVHILVLGAGYTDDKRLPENSQLSTTVLVRLAEGIRIHRQIAGSVIITSADAGIQELAQAEVVAKAAVLLGVDESNIRKQLLPKNTLTEATEYKRLFGDTAQLVLVTSAIHMPRAMFLFQKAELKPLAAPTHYLVKKEKKRGFRYWIPSSENIKKTESALHEYAGLLWAKMGGEK